MAWTRRSTTHCMDVAVYLSEIDPPQLLQALIDAQIISEPEADAILTRSGAKSGKQLKLDAHDVNELELATIEMNSGRKNEALIHVERLLGSWWIGRLTS